MMTERELLQRALNHIEGLPGNADLGSEIRAYLAQPPAGKVTFDAWYGHKRPEYDGMEQSSYDDCREAWEAAHLAQPPAEPIGSLSMTLRDYFAAKAMPYVQGSGEDFDLKTICNMLDIPIEEYTWITDYQKFCALMSYKFADAMLKEREK
jgi:hypothetical protein